MAIKLAVDNSGDGEDAPISDREFAAFAVESAFDELEQVTRLYLDAGGDRQVLYDHLIARVQGIHPDLARVHTRSRQRLVKAWAEGDRMLFRKVR
jgi:hypothetical protein